MELTRFSQNRALGLVRFGNAYVEQAKAEKGAELWCLQDNITVLLPLVAQEMPDGRKDKLRPRRSKVFGVYVTNVLKHPVELVCIHPLMLHRPGAAREKPYPAASVGATGTEGKGEEWRHQPPQLLLTSLQPHIWQTLWGLENLE